MSLIKSISGIRRTIGGQAGDNLTPLDAVKFAAAYGTWIKKGKKSATVVIGRDARISGKMISGLVSNTLVGLGINVILMEVAVLSFMALVLITVSLKKFKTRLE